MNGLKTAIALTALSLAAWPSVASAQDIYIINKSSVPAEQVANALPAFQAALDDDFTPAWNTPATLHFDVHSPPARSWKITLRDDTGIQGAAGYHDVNRYDTPYAVVGTGYKGVNWQTVFTHELFEMLADPHVDRVSVQFPGEVFYMIEVADPVEEAYYTLPGADGTPVQISDFVTEQFYDGKAGRYDFLGKLTRPLSLLPGGYITFSVNGVWQQVFNRKGKIVID